MKEWTDCALLTRSTLGYLGWRLECLLGVQEYGQHTTIWHHGNSSGKSITLFPCVLCWWYFWFFYSFAMYWHFYFHFIITSTKHKKMQKIRKLGSLYWGTKVQKALTLFRLFFSQSWWLMYWMPSCFWCFYSSSSFEQSY